ncbi:MAG TPA: DUF4239 domain-containing protein [Planctomycetota bacterium]|nr:DUF4239 domain-containing protein [Planctomycetota bacterium]
MWFIAENPNLLLFGIPLALFVGMLVMLELGRRAGLRRLAKDPEGAKERLGTVEGAIFGLLGLLIAFTFSGAAGRFDDRRKMVVQEANQLGDAWSRIDALPEKTQPPIRDAMRRYLESRLETYRRIPDMKAVDEELERSAAIQDEIWKAAVAACAMPEGQRVTMLVLPALDSAFDWTLVRTASAMHHPPGIIWIMLFVLSFGSALIAGYGMTGGRKRNWTYMIGFAAVIAIAVYTILDIEFPRVGLVRVDAVDQLLTDLLETMRKS